MNRKDFFKRVFIIPFATYFLRAKSEDIKPTVTYFKKKCPNCGFEKQISSIVEDDFIRYEPCSNCGSSVCISPTPMPIVTPTHTPTVTKTPSGQWTATVTPTPTVTPTSTVSGTPPPNVKKLNQLDEGYKKVGESVHDSWWYAEYSNGTNMVLVDMNKRTY
jgi:hypothetical protein